MGGSGWKIRTAHSRNAPHPPLRRSPFPVGEGWGKSFPYGGAGRALALTEEGRSGRERLEKGSQSTPERGALERAYFRQLTPAAPLIHHRLWRRSPFHILWYSCHRQL